MLVSVEPATDVPWAYGVSHLLPIGKSTSHPLEDAHAPHDEIVLALGIDAPTAEPAKRGVFSA